MFGPDSAYEDPAIRQALALCETAGINVTYHEDTIEVCFGLNNTRFYSLWPHFLADVRALFGDRMEEPEQASPPAAIPLFEEPVVPTGFGKRGANPGAGQSAASSAAAEQIRALKAEIKLLERAIKVVGMQRDEWQKEAESLRQELETMRIDLRDGAAARSALLGGDRYKQVRQIIVRRLHPDVFGTDEEKQYREKLFKTIWGEIEQLDKA